MNLFKKLMKKICEHHTGEPDNLVILIDPTVIPHPERCYTMIKQSFDETGVFTLHNANCIPVILGGTNYHAVTEHFNLTPSPDELTLGWADRSEIISNWTDDRKFMIKFTVPPYDLGSNKNGKVHRFAVVENMKINTKTGIGRSAWYGDFETKEEAEKFIEESKLENVGILDLEDAIVEIKEGK